MHCYETCVMIEIHFSLESKWRLREKTKSNGKHYVMKKGRDKKQEGEKKKNDWFVLFCRVDISMSVPEQLHAYCSPNPTLTCY